MKKNNILFVFLLFSMLWCINACRVQNLKYVTKIDKVTLLKHVKGKQKQLIDVRSVEEYDAGHIDNAINVDIANKENFKQKMNKLDKSKPVYIYCTRGIRSYRASKILQTLGFKEIYDFSGGWSTWNK